MVATNPPRSTVEREEESSGPRLPAPAPPLADPYRTTAPADPPCSRLARRMAAAALRLPMAQLTLSSEPPHR
jgi:hypothetical protein